MTSRAIHRKTIAILAFTQITSWGSLYYAFAILAPAIQHELGWRAEIVFGAFSWCLLVAGLASTPLGMLLDRHGGRSMMGLGSLLCGSGMIALSLTHGVAHYFAAWTVLGIAMPLVLYEAAFATINREFLHDSRRGISTLTLFGGFASTVFWPLTLKLNTLVGWRETYLIYGVLQLALCAPLHALMSARKKSKHALDAAAVVARTDVATDTAIRSVAGDSTLKQALRHPAFWKLALAFAANSFVFSALSVHLIPLLHQFGHPIATAVLFGALIGPMQVAGRIGEMAFAARTRPQTVGKITFAALPAALVALLLLGQQQWAVAAFCILYGLSNGILTIVRGTIPQALFGREHYGAISGALAGPALLAKAAGPLAIAAVIEISPSPLPIVAVVLLVSIVSMGFYLAAIRAPRAGIGT